MTDGRGGRSLAALRRAVEIGVSESEVCVALSGGPDSLALTAAAVAAGRRVLAVVVDHGLQEDSDRVAATAAEQARSLGADACVVAVEVGPAVDAPRYGFGGGPEAAAREARYAALDAARAGRPVLLGHTLDDQAETVLLKLARGGGARALAGMRACNGQWRRPLLGERRATTHAACAELGLAPWSDPHNNDPRYLRSRLRAEAMPVLTAVLGDAGVVALARAAADVAADVDELDRQAAELAPGPELLPAATASLPAALRRRVVRDWLADLRGSPPGERLVLAVDALLLGAAGEVWAGGDAAGRIVVRAGPDGLSATWRVRTERASGLISRVSPGRASAARTAE